jgi:hypothetical protein
LKDVFRASLVLFTLLAYLAGAGHCALATMACLATDNGRCHTPAAISCVSSSPNICTPAGNVSSISANQDACPAHSSFSHFSVHQPLSANFLPADAPDSRSAGQDGSIPHPDHIPHESDCSIDALLSTQNPESGTARLPSPHVLFVVAAFCAIGCLCARCQALAVQPTGLVSFVRRTRERLLLLARGWQFLTRAALPSRAPSV